MGKAYKQRKQEALMELLEVLYRAHEAITAEEREPINQAVALVLGEMPITIIRAVTCLHRSKIEIAKTGHPVSRPMLKVAK